MPAEFYNNVLYPLQDKVFPLFNNTPFYLTGGTTLSRGYFNHRYSDDLVYFVNDYHEFLRISERQIEKLEAEFKEVKVALKDNNFCRVFIGEEKLKIEMINDVPAHAGQKVNHPLLGLIDSKENILANKITAVVDRILPKDIVDIYFLLKDGLSLKKSLIDAESKAAGISPLLVSKVFAEFPYDIIDSEIKWIKPVPGETIKHFMNDISLAIVKGLL